MRNQTLHAAILAALAGGAAGMASAPAEAATYQLHISGASAQRTLWQKDLEAYATGKFGSLTDAATPANTVCTVYATAAAYSTTAGTPYAAPYNTYTNSAVPDMATLVCTVSATRFSGAPTLPGTIVAGDTLILAYEAEYGSVWGIAPYLSNSPSSTRGRLELVPNAACSGAANAANLVPYFRDTDTSPSTCYTAPTLVDAGVSDNDPVLWASTDNWSYSDGLYPPAALNGTAINGSGSGGVINILADSPTQAQPTISELQALETSSTFKYVNGEVFAIVVDNSTAGMSLGPTSGITELSTQSVRSIISGKYKTWSQVPEAALLAHNTASIVVCRRDHGSGSEVTFSTYFTGQECGGNNGTGPTGNAAGGAPRVVSQADSPSGAAFGSLDKTVGFVNGYGPQNPFENFSTNDIKSCLSANPGVSIGVIVLGGTSSAYNQVNIDGVAPNAHNGALGLYQFVAEDWGYNGSVATQGAGSNTALLMAGLFTDVSKTTGVLPAETGTIVNGQWNNVSSPQTNFYLQDGLNAAPTVTAATETGNGSVPTAVWTNAPKSACYIKVNANK